MKNIILIEEDRTVQLAKGWGLSIALHGCLILAAMTAMPKLTLTLEQEPFRWDVALVEAPAPAPSASAPAPPVPAPSPAKPAQAKPQPARPAEPASQRITRQIEQQEVPQPVTREAEPVQREVRVAQLETQPIRQEIERVQQEMPHVQRDMQPIQRELHPREEAQRPSVQREPARDAVAMERATAQAQEIKSTEIKSTERADTGEAAARTEAVQETTRAVQQHATQAVPEPVERREVPVAAAKQAETRIEPQAVARPPVMESQPAMPIEQKPAAIQSAASTALDEPAPVSPPAVSEAVEPPPAPPVSAATTDRSAPAVQEQAPVVARSVSPSPARKADYGWLAESLHRRIVEVRQYPSVARLNGWEGKVVLRVQIRQDGHLESVSVVKSSGHETLDNAAMEAVRRACPLHMQHELAAPMVVVQVPINYSLNR